MPPAFIASKYGIPCNLGTNATLILPPRPGELPPVELEEPPSDLLQPVSAKAILVPTTAAVSGQRCFRFMWISSRIGSWLSASCAWTVRRRRAPPQAGLSPQCSRRAPLHVERNYLQVLQTKRKPLVNVKNQIVITN